MSSREDDGPGGRGRAPELQVEATEVTTKEHQFGLGAPVSEAGTNKNTLQLEQEVRTQDRFISTLKLQIEDLKQTNHDLEEYVRKLLDSKEVVSSQVNDLTNHNEHLCKELIKIDQLAEQLEKEKNFVVDTANKELEETKIELICQQNNITVLEDTIKRLKSIILDTEKAQNKSPSRLDSFVKTLEADRDYYKTEAQNLRKMIRNRSKSPRRPSPSSRGANCDVDLLKSTARDREELKCMLEKYERHLAEIQGNVKVLTSERDKTFLLYEQAQEEIARLRREMMKTCKSPKSTTAHAILRRVETERDVAFTDLRRMTTERDSLRERLKIAQETAFNEKAHLEQRIEELECTVHNLDDERMEQMSNMTLMKETITTVEKEMKSLARKAMDTESELGRQKAENNSLRLLYENTEKDLSDTQRHLAKKKYELQLTQEKIMCLDEKIDNFTRQSIAQREEISILGATLNDLAKEKECLQACLDKKSENIASLGESLAMKEKTISGMKNIIAEMEQASRQSTEALIMCEQDISRMRRQLDETNDELAQIARERDILAHENDALQEQFNKAKQENQALSKKLNDTHNELNDIKQKVQDTNLEVNKLKNILKSEESENRQIMEQLRKANEDAENWENKARQAEAENNNLKLELITAEAEVNRLKEKVDALNRELEQHLNAERSYKSQISTLHKSLVKMEEELQKVQFEKVSALADLSSTRELCIKLDSSKELLNRQLVAKDQEIEMMENELDSARSEIELLRSQMTNERISMQNLEALLVANRDKEYQSQIALQEKESEIQLLKEHLCLAENKMAIQSRDVAQFRNVVTQLEADLDITKRQLGTERFERERAVQELRRQNYSSNVYHLSSVKPNSKCHSPDRAHHRSPDRGLDRSLEENLCYRDF
ncbi:testis-specific gene 10 protein isoform X1 [Cricetulus griseus]|uniref:Testis-specific gene 10 protein isoform X1 n=3 Tax=Cricetulus griseus TaxID=10029 RepID=A0A9J7EZ50_CRIGR|nr:testis-specific gene 10 protein isoform X1 [Cricetulus griseus]XP_027242622.1 testis-specific gene 10 protein isoform X1 [Cricetulus griseus]